MCRIFAGQDPATYDSVTKSVRLSGHATSIRLEAQFWEILAEIAEREGKDGWSFAAPASIHSAVVELLPADVREKIVEYVKSDLVKIEPAKLPAHFRSLQPV